MLVSKLHKKDITNEIIDKILYDGLSYNGEAAECALEGSIPDFEI